MRRPIDLSLDRIGRGTKTIQSAIQGRTPRDYHLIIITPRDAQLAEPAYAKLQTNDFITVTLSTRFLLYIRGRRPRVV